MPKYHFMDDYSEGCHPDILAALAASNMSQETAYGNDSHSIEARQFIRRQIGSDDTAVFFVSGGTLANLIIAASALRSHEAVISADIGHIAMRETGAIEATGHKVITVPAENGKLTPAGIENAIAGNAHAPHMTKPRLVYISNATEAGTIYSKAELQAISTLCRANRLLLMMDGARLATALAADNNDLTLKDIAGLTDIFWIGGTKAGALIGEAIVIPNAALADDFEFHIKQRGALLAKGRLLGVQFAELFRNDLFFSLARHANSMARELSEAIVAAGYSLHAKTESNQVFPLLPQPVIEKLGKRFGFYPWQKVDDDTAVIRLVTSWATDPGQVARFIKALREQD